MKNIEVKILDSNLNGMPKFLARLTQRGHIIKDMEDVTSLYNSCIDTPPSKELLALPHATIKRMNYITVAVSGLSTKAVSQLRTHATRLTFISTSTQYSKYDGATNESYVIPDGLTDIQKNLLKMAYDSVQHCYERLLYEGVDKDIASYILPQGLRKTLIISGNLDAWAYVMNVRLCNRNTLEVQYIMKQIYNAIKEQYGEEYVAGMLPSCMYGKCKEGKFCCGKEFKI